MLSDEGHTKYCECLVVLVLSSALLLQGAGVSPDYHVFGVPFQVEFDNRKNFTSDKAFHSFKKQRWGDTLLELLYIYNGSSNDLMKAEGPEAKLSEMILMFYSKYTNTRDSNQKNSMIPGGTGTSIST